MTNQTLTPPSDPSPVPSSGSTRPRLVLIDGHAVAYRVYYATIDTMLKGNAFRTSKGEPTNAVYGFANVLLDQLRSKTPPDYIAVVFDQGLSQRETVFADYKAQRKEMDADMASQMPRIYELVRTFNIPILEIAGFEADDVIGTVAHRADELGVQVYIITGDTDMLQLVTEHVGVERLVARGPAKIYDIQAVIDAYGVRPDQFIDYKALIGDVSDNYPGVKGVGEKTAAKLLQQYDTLDNVYAHVDEQKGKLQEYLVTGRDNAFRGQQLATILTNLPVEVDLARCIAHDYDPHRVDALFQELEFNSIRRRLGIVPEAELAPRAKPAQVVPTPTTTQLSMFMDEELLPAPVHTVDTVVVDSAAALADLVAVLDKADAIAFDTEGSSTDQMRLELAGISLAVDGERGYYLPVGHFEQTERQLPLAQVIDALRPALTDPNKAKYAHNAVFDVVVLRRYGIDVQPITVDTMIGEWLLHPISRQKGLKDQARMRLGVTMQPIEELIGKGKAQVTMNQVPIDRVAPYAAADAAMTFRLVEPICADLDKEGLTELFKTIEMPLVPVIANLNMAGVTLDLPYLAELSREFEQRLHDIMTSIHHLAGMPFNVGSPKQLNDVLFGKLGLSTDGLSKSTHGYSLNAGALESLRDAHPIIDLILEWRMLDKLRSTYVDALQQLVDKHGRVHTTYNQTGAATGRLSSEAPNLQNIPIRTEEGRRVRRAFIAPQGYRLLSVDYSQIELRLMAHLSGDKFLIEAFEQGQDIHRATAAAVLGIPPEQVSKEQRYFAKRVNFGLLYGMGAHRLTRESELNYEDAKAFVDQYFQRLPGVKAYLDGSKNKAYKEGILTTLLGRKRDFSLLSHPSTTRTEKAAIEREAINMPVQGSAADIMKLAMIDVSRRLKDEFPEAKLILQVHDELVVEVPEAQVDAIAAMVCESMENVIVLNVPLRVEASVGQNWAELEPLHH